MASQRHCENVMVCPVNCAGIVLAGGQSRRMGRPKALLPFGPESMLQRVVRIVGEVVHPVVVAAQVAQKLPPLPQSITVVCDRRSNLGPLEGLAVALAALQGRADAAFVTGCDTPLLPPPFVRRMSELLADFDAVVPCIDGVDQPLLAVYRTSILPRVEQLAGADGRLIALFDRLNFRRVAADLLADVDPHGDLLIRINTPADYQLSLARAGLAADA
jgi:molybdenum cofactor guanylyltransferase